MLRIHTATSAKDAIAYFSTADYYSEGQETIGKWGGKLADRFGLCGTVDRETFSLFCHNLRPDGTPLTVRTKGNRRVGWDFTFSGPKSFSVLEALADAPTQTLLRDAFDAAVEDTMGEIEADFAARDRRNGSDSDRTTGNLLYASFDHSTSRPVEGEVPDMHRHKHVFCFNATYDPVEHRIKAAQIGDVVRDKWYYQAAFYARLAHRLEGLGVAIERKGGMEWEVQGIGRDVIDLFSKRSAEIEAEAERRGITDASEKGELGAKTRSAKAKELPLSELRSRWRNQLSLAQQDSIRKVLRRDAVETPRIAPDQAVQFAIDHLSEQNSVWPVRELKRLALMRGLGQVLPGQLDDEISRQDVIVRTREGRKLATTPHLLHEEDSLIGFARAGQGAVRPIGVPKDLSPSLRDGKSLNDGQWQTCLGLLNSCNRVNVIEGPAGSGKSWLLKKADEGLQVANRSVIFLASTTDAASVLERDGFTVNTVARFLLDERMQKEATDSYVFIDETSLLGHKDAVRLCQIARDRNLRLTFIGDRAQHSAVPRGAILRLLTDFAGVRPFTLEEIKRQQNVNHLSAVKSLAKGKTAEGFEMIERLGWVKEVGDGSERCRRVAYEYIQALNDKKSVICIAPTHSEGASITKEIRNQLRQAKKLGKDREFTRLILSNASQAERTLSSTYHPGDVLEYVQNAKGRTKGERIVVTDLRSVPLDQAKAFQLYRQEKISLAQGDRVRFTASVKTIDGRHKLRNGDIKTVAGFDRKGNIKLDNGWIVSSSAGHFRSAWVDTSFSSQGRTVQRAILAASSESFPAVNQEQIYVSSSRASESMTIFTDDIESLRRSIFKGSQKLVAVDLRPNDTADTSRKGRLKFLQQRRRRLSLVEKMRSAWEKLTGGSREVSRER